MASPQTIQPSTIDTNLSKPSPTTNYGTSSTITVQPVPLGPVRSILAFDFSAVVPAGATITLATLSLYCTFALASRTITVYRLLRTDWVETEATWNIYKTGSNWSTAGAFDTTNDITTTDAATATSVSKNAWLDETVTAQVQTALDSVSGIAHFLIADTGGNGFGNNDYASSEYATSSSRPKLYIEYTEAVSATSINIGDTFKAIDFAGSKLNVGDAWKAIRTVKVNIGDAWKRVYSSPAVLNEDDSYILMESGTDDRIEVE